MRPLADWEVQLHFKKGGDARALLALHQAYNEFKKAGVDMTVNQLRGSDWGEHPDPAIGSASILSADGAPVKEIPKDALEEKKEELLKLKEREIDPYTDERLAKEFPELFGAEAVAAQELEGGK